MGEAVEVIRKAFQRLSKKVQKSYNVNIKSYGSRSWQL